jgi:hypothetical protein
MFQLNVSPEVLSLGQALGILVADIKAGKSAIQDAEDMLAPVLAAVGAAATIGTDIKTADNQAFLVYSILTALGV